MPTDGVSDLGIVTFAALVVFLPRGLFISPFPDPILRPVLFTIIAGTVGALTGLARSTLERSRRFEAIARDERDQLLRVLGTMEDGFASGSNITIGPVPGWVG
jgi:hypothetical protein